MNSKSIVRQGLPYKNRAIDCDIWHWRNSVLNLRDGKLVTKSEVQSYARESYSKAGISNFKASDGWYRRWISRWTNVESDVNAKDKAVACNPVRLEKKERKVVNKDKLKVGKVTGSIKSVLVSTKDVTKDILNCESVNQDSVTTHDRTCSKNTSEFEDKEKQKNPQKESEKKVKHNVSVVNKSVKVGNKINVANTGSTGQNDNCQQQLQHSNVDKELFKDMILCIDNTPIDHFLNTSVLDKSNEIYCKEYENSSQNNSNEPSKFMNEIFINKNCDNRPQHSPMVMSDSSEIAKVLRTEKGKKITTVSSDCNVNKVRKKGERYLPHFKSKVATYAAASSIKTAALKFNVNRGTVSEWLKEKERRTAAKVIAKPISSADNNVQADLVFIKWLESHWDKLSRQLILKKTWELFEQYGEATLQKTCPWFLAYIKRLNEKKFEQKLIEKKYIMYPEKFKLQVVKYADKFSQLAAARLFLIARKRVFEWLYKVKSTGTIETKSPVNPSSYVTDPEVDDQISNWYKEQSVTPTSKQVRDKGRQLYKKAGYTLNCSHGWYYRWRLRLGLPAARSDTSIHDSFLLEWILTELDNNQNLSHSDLLSVASKLKKTNNNSQFKPSLGWVFRFCKRYPELLQTIPDFIVALPYTMERKVETYKNNFLSYVKNNDITLENIISMDEIPLHFLLSGNNKRKLLIRKPGFDNCQGSLVVSSLANGTLLPFMLILKGTATSQPECIGANSIVVSETGCIDDDIMLLWLQRICFINVVENGILINDCFEHHSCAKAVVQLLLHKVQHLVIPGGCSSRLQPLNYIAQQLKHNVEQFWADSLTPECWADGTSRLEPPNHTQIVDWVQKSYSCVAATEKENIKAVFHQIFFSKEDSIDVLK